MAHGPAVGLAIVDSIKDDPQLRKYHLVSAMRGDLLAKVGRLGEARIEFEKAASMTKNTRERDMLLDRARE